MKANAVPRHNPWLTHQRGDISKACHDDASQSAVANLTSFKKSGLVRFIQDDGGLLLDATWPIPVGR